LSVLFGDFLLNMFRCPKRREKFENLKNKFLKSDIYH
jgi:hypothetical protein